MEQKTENSTRFGEEKCGVNIVLTPEQTSKLSLEKGFSLYNIGFISPERIVSYDCEHCNKSFEESPKIEVYITVQIGEVASIMYRCNTCNEYIYGSHVKNANNIPEQFIVLDETGDFKKPTPNSIEDLFKQLEEDVKKGHGSNPNRPPYEDKLKILHTWCAKIGYVISSERINTLKSDWKDSYLARFTKNLSERVDSIIRFDRFSFNFDPTEDNGMGYYSSALPEKLDELFRTLPHITLPDDSELKMKILKIHQLYVEMLENAKEFVKEKKSELEEIISELDESSFNAAKAAAKFVLQANLTYEQSESVKQRSFEEDSSF